MNAVERALAAKVAERDEALLANRDEGMELSPPNNKRKKKAEPTGKTKKKQNVRISKIFSGGKISPCIRIG